MARKIVKFRDYLKDQMKDPEIRRHWEAYDLPVRLAIEIAMLRQKRRMTQAQLARKMRVSQQMVAQLENPEENTAPNVRTLEKVAQALGAQLHIGFRWNLNLRTHPLQSLHRRQYPQAIHLTASS